ncbi:cilia- and flagella-associated protein 36 [Aplysia californica]|uniref:Cilia- and flagella-associated protein 36 n=1 Tax=Aplysia californica TaxID=6500 RepID=A0ABM0JPN7_APLCA|nr:cilia- and flagella-associated protein 36 [Aplysia californica]
MMGMPIDLFHTEHSSRKNAAAFSTAISSVITRGLTKSVLYLHEKNSLRRMRNLDYSRSDALASYRFKMAAKKSEYVIDELICFLSNPLFQVPVLSFMESKCLIFDPSIEDSPGYREVHDEYKKLVDLLLEGFRTDTGLTHDQIIKAMKDLNSKPDLRDIFQVLFEQVLATEDFPVFVRIMAQKNLELQQQALMLISQMMDGSLPESLVKDSGGVASGRGKPTDSEDQILIAVLAKSKEEYEQVKKQSTKEEEELQLIIGISRTENARLAESMKSEQEKLSETMKKSLSLDDRPPPIIKGPSQPVSSAKPALAKSASIPPPASYQPKRQSSTTSAPHPVVAQHGLKPKGSNEPGQTSAQAAAAWMKSAESEVGASDAHSRAVQAAAANMAGMSEEEYKKRAEFLKQQRDKLMEMKRKEREKQLLTAEKSQPQRPASARAARAALKHSEESGAAQSNAEEEKKLAMRRAIADRIKSELMNQAKK